MRGGWAIALLAVVLAPASLSLGQMRGGGRMVAPAGRFGFAPRSSVFFNGGFGFGHSRFRSCFNCSPFFFPRRRFFFSGSFFSSPVYYYPYYPVYGGYPYPVTPPSTYYSDDYYQQGELRRDIDVLTGKVDRLREDVDARIPRPRPKPEPEAGPRPQTVLVFRDHHIREVQNYAIVGDTLWVFNAQRAERIPLADLDLDSTTRLNDERGVEFQMPK